jgi:Tfp pilus assembly protein PilF
MPAFSKPEETSKPVATTNSTAQKSGAGADSDGKKVEDTDSENEIVVYRRKQEEIAISHFNLAQRYLSRWDFNLGELELQEAITFDPDLKIAHRDLCVASVFRGNIGQAVAEFAMATGLGDPIPYTEKEKEELNKNGAKLHYRKALSYAGKNRWKTAIFEFKLAQAYAPENTAIKHSLAFAYAKDGRFDLAEKFYLETIAAAPGDSSTHADFAFMLSDEGKREYAFDQLTKAVELQPDSAALHVDLSFFSEKKGDLKEASEQLEQAIKLSPKHAALWARLGRLCASQGDSVGAKKAYATAIALDPQQNTFKDELAKLNTPTDQSKSNN